MIAPASAAFPRLIQKLIFFCMLLGFGLHSLPASAELPLANGSAMAGFAFSDRPMMLSPNRDFQAAMIAASADVARSCGKLEAYGWRVGNDQPRVNAIFRDTVNGLRDLGYEVAPQSSSISQDITLIAADRPDKHFLLMWSTSDLGLVMVMCQSSAVLHNKNATGYDLPAPKLSTPRAEPIIASKLDAPTRAPAPEAPMVDFTPAGDWIGSYVCAQGETGGTLHIDHADGKNFDGVFRFYATQKNPLVPSGSYQVSGQYDLKSKHIRIVPGTWIERPLNYYNTVILGQFDADGKTFSGYFQGVEGCSSFEAKYTGGNLASEPNRAPIKKSAPKKKKKKLTAGPVVFPATSGTDASPISIVPDVQPVVPLHPVAHPPVPQKSGALEQPAEGKIVVASGEWFTPTTPQAPQATVFTPTVPTVSPAPRASTTVPTITNAPTVPAAQQYQTTVPQVARAPQLPEAQQYDTTVPTVSAAPRLPPANFITPTVPQLPRAPEITIGSDAQ